MYSIRKFKSLFIPALALAVSTVGCTRLGGYIAKANQNAETHLDEGVIPQDPAMERRMWAESAIVYPSGRTVAGPTLFAVEPAAGIQRGYTYSFLDSFLFFGNIAALPYTAIRGGVRGEVISNGESVGPGFTGVGELPTPIGPRGAATPAGRFGVNPLPQNPQPGQPGAALPGR